MADEVTPQKRNEAVFALILGILQVCGLFGASVGKYAEWLNVNQAVALAVISAAVGIVQTFVTSVRARKLKAAK